MVVDQPDPPTRPTDVKAVGAKQANELSPRWKPRPDIHSVNVVRLEVVLESWGARLTVGYPRQSIGFHLLLQDWCPRENLWTSNRHQIRSRVLPNSRGTYRTVCTEFAVGVRTLEELPMNMQRLHLIG